MQQRDDFNEAVKRTLSARVGAVCSNPTCRALTSGPHEDAGKAINLGVAAHITAAAPGGPRYDSTLTAEQRASVENAIWLCQNCAKLIDNDPGRFPVALLREWKTNAEEEACSRIGRTFSPGADGASTTIVNIHGSTIGALGVGTGARSTGEIGFNPAGSPPAPSPPVPRPVLRVEDVCFSVEARYSFDHSGVILTCEIGNETGRRLKIREIRLEVEGGLVFEPDDPPAWKNLGGTWCGPGPTEAIEPDDLKRLSWFLPAPELREHFRRGPSLAAELHVRYFPVLEVARAIIIEILDSRQKRTAQFDPSEALGTSADPVRGRPVGQEQPHAGSASVARRDEARENWITSERPYVKFIAPPGWSKNINGDWGVFISPSGAAIFAFTTFARLEEATARLNQVASVLGVAEVEWRSPQPGNIGRDGFHALKGEGTCSFRGPGGYIWYALANTGTSDQLLLVYTVSMTGTQANKEAVLTSIKSLQRR